jgi:5-methylcytosine-specific restriction endonuclease McrA
MADSIEQMIRRLASDRCEYCRVPESGARFRHVMDHVIARQHGGTTVIENLALCCGRCNQYKGPNISSIDPDTHQMARLFHPRLDQWPQHFRYERAVLIGLTPVGRATIVTLRINHPLRIAARQALIETGVHF